MKPSNRIEQFLADMDKSEQAKEAKKPEGRTLTKEERQARAQKIRDGWAVIDSLMLVTDQNGEADPAKVSVEIFKRLGTMSLDQLGRDVGAVAMLGKTAALTHQMLMQVMLMRISGVDPTGPEAQAAIEEFKREEHEGGSGNED